MLMMLTSAALVPSLFAQVDSTLIRVQNTQADSMIAGMPVYFSTGFQERAASLSTLLQEGDAYLHRTLGLRSSFRLAVLDEGDWGQVWSLPYGLPYVSLGAPWVVVLPAAPEKSVMHPMFSAMLEPDQVQPMIDNIGFHEVGHIYISEYLYPETHGGPPPVRWLDEFLAQYLAYAVLKETSPERTQIWDVFTGVALSAPAPRFTSLSAFDAEYYGYLGTPEGTPNYGWYQSAFAKQAAEIFEERGLDFLQEVKENLAWESFDPWTTASVLAQLEDIHPGFLAWQAALAGGDE